MLVFYTASSSRSYCAFAATFEAMEAPYFQWEKVLEFPGRRDLMDNIVPEEFVAEENLNYDKEVSINEGVSEDDETIKRSNLPPPPADKNPSEVICHGPLTFDPLPSQEEGEDTQLAATNNQTKLMHWHYCLGHLPFTKLKQLALNGEIPMKLAKAKPPKCTGCLFGAMTKIPWHGREAKASREVFVATKLGQCVSVDQMTSREVGFNAQMKGKLTKKQYRCATIIVDHYSCLRFIHLQINNSFVKTVATKCTFESFAAKNGIKIQHYHCDNGQFSNNWFKQACHKQRQQLTFCGVNSHFQNGIAKQAIHNLSESACKQLLHACACWPQVVHFALWPYALRNAALLHNSLPVLEGGTLRLELFSTIRVGCNMKHVHTFGCPEFALQNMLASGNQLPRWSPCACLGLNLGPSPMHARNVYLVLYLITQCVSPQYHCRFDNFFEMTHQGGPDVSGTICWQQLAGLDRTTTILSKVSAPIQRSVIYPETPSEDAVPLEEISVVPPFHEFTVDNQSVSDKGSQVTENEQPSHQSQAFYQKEGVTSIEPTVTAGTSQCGRRKMSRRMAESVAQGMHHMAHQSTLSETNEDLFHDAHLELQERMQNPIAFHAEMMGDILYLQQALRQPDAKEFVQAVIKEVNGHVECKIWTLKKRSKVP